jgi:hypothetical protein
MNDKANKKNKPYTILQTIYHELVNNRIVKNQKEFADLLGYENYSYVSRLLKYIKPLPGDLQRLLHKLLDVDLNWLATMGAAGTPFVAYPGMLDAVKGKGAKGTGTGKKGAEQVGSTQNTNGKLKDGIDFEGITNSHINDQSMILEMMQLMKHQNANVDKIAGALDKIADANQSMARSIEHLVAKNNSGAGGKEQAA